MAKCSISDDKLPFELLSEKRNIICDSVFSLLVILSRGPKLAPPVSKTLQIFIKIQSASLFPSGFVRNFSVFNSKDNDSEHENEWERLLKPYDLTELRRSFNQITPFQLCKLLELPLDVETSMEIFKWAGAQKGYCHSFSVYYLLIDKLGAAAGFKVIDRLLLQMKEEGIVFRESLFILIMKYYGRAGLPGQATRLLLDMKGVYCCEPSCRSYNAVLHVLVVGNCPSVASNVFYDMLNKGISPNDYTFGLVMKALCMVNEVDNACLLLRDMTKHGCVPNSVIYQTLIDALSKRDRVDEALKLLEEMFLMGCPPDVNTFNTVIYGFCRLNRVLEGAKLVDRMILKGFTPNDLTYGYLMHGLCKTEREHLIMHVFFSIEVLRMALYLMMLHGISWCTILVDKVTQSVRPSPMLSFRDRKVPSVLGRWNLFWPSELFFMKVAMTGFVLCLLVGFLDWIPVKEIGANLSQELLRREASR
ncbi:hypothetical protein OIU76_010686 [Salix suchowensis]|nr:hypothetical protein OIU76_010686 [Salix suchowensis]KAJ6332348.1 hypothetical protein OIU76_010686 [Salix suchowensis]KAJ6332349.1 hypothetical protein OIU76_010686 [Salix suchowensis]